VGRALDRDDETGAFHALGRLTEIFGRDRIWVELGRHLDADEELRNRRLVELARRLDLPLVATNDVHYARREGHRLHDVLTCARHQATVDEIGRRLPRSGERHLKSPVEMADLFRDLPEAIRNTLAVAERCSYTLADLGYQFPDYACPDGRGHQEELVRLCHERAPSRFGEDFTDKARAQLDRELALIGKLDLAGYFLIVWDLIEYCRRRKIMVQGRGSAANSAVCFALGITAVDPVKKGLLFERFLSEERGEWPDIDLDLPSGDQREEVIQYVYRTYGAHRVAMTANVITYRSRMAVRDVGRALGFSEEQLGRMSPFLSGWGFVDGKDTIKNQLAQAGFVADVADSQPLRNAEPGGAPPSRTGGEAQRL
jgi:error-prone DNA polymerase